MLAQAANQFPVEAVLVDRSNSWEIVIATAVTLILSILVSWGAVYGLDRYPGYSVSVRLRLHNPSSSGRFQASALVPDASLRLDSDWSGDRYHEINVVTLGVGRNGIARADSHRLRRDTTAALNQPNISFLVELGLSDRAGGRRQQRAVHGAR
jgi:hypothetical protein